MICFLLKDKSSRETAAKLSIEKSTVNNIFLKHTNGYGFQDLPGSGRRRKMTIHLDRIVRRKAVDDPQKNDAAIIRDLRSENYAEISQSTLSRF